MREAQRRDVTAAGAACSLIAHGLFLFTSSPSPPTSIASQASKMNAHSSSDSEDDETDSTSVTDSASVTDSEASIAEIYSDLADEITSGFDLATADGNFLITAFFPVLRRHRRHHRHRPERTRDAMITSYFTRLRRSSPRSLFDLPPELRVQIYEYSLPQIRLPATDDSQITCNRCLGEVCLLEEQRSYSPAKPSRGYTALLLTCKAIYKEAVDVLYSPTRFHVPPDFGRVVLHISTRRICLHDYNMLCTRHLACRKGTESTFSRMRYVELNITVDDQQFWGIDRDSDSTTLSGWAYSQENIQWVVHQLREAVNLEKLILSIDWMEYATSMENIRDVLGHFGVLRNIPHMELRSSGKIEWIIGKKLSKFNDYMSELQALLAGSDLVHEPPVPFHFWNLLKRLLVQFPVDYRNIVMEEAGLYYWAQYRKEVQKVMVDMYSTCLGNGDLWAKFGKRLMDTAYVGLLCRKDRSNSCGPLR